MPNVPYPYEVKWQISHRKWFLNTNLFLIKPFLIVKFDCTKKVHLNSLTMKSTGKFDQYKILTTKSTGKSDR